MFEFLAKGGVLVGPILLCSVVALALFLERFIRYSRVKVCGNGLVAGMSRHLRNGEHYLVKPNYLPSPAAKGSSRALPSSSGFALFSMAGGQGDDKG